MAGDVCNKGPITVLFGMFRMSIWTKMKWEPFHMCLGGRDGCELDRAI